MTSVKLISWPKKEIGAKNCKSLFCLYIKHNIWYRSRELTYMHSPSRLDCFFSFFTYYRGLSLAKNEWNPASCKEAKANLYIYSSKQASKQHAICSMLVPCKCNNDQEPICSMSVPCCCNYQAPILQHVHAMLIKDPFCSILVACWCNNQGPISQHVSAMLIQ